MPSRTKVSQWSDRRNKLASTTNGLMTSTIHFDSKTSILEGVHTFRRRDSKKSGPYNDDDKELERLHITPRLVTQQSCEKDLNRIMPYILKRKPFKHPSRKGLRLLQRILQGNPLQDIKKGLYKNEEKFWAQKPT